MEREKKIPSYFFIITKGIDVMTLVLINKKEKGDTLKVIIYGKDCRYFRIGNDYYESKNSILDKVQNWEVSK